MSFTDSLPRALMVLLLKGKSIKQYRLWGQQINAVSRLSSMKKRSGQQESTEQMYPEPQRTWMARSRFNCFGARKCRGEGKAGSLTAISSQATVIREASEEKTEQEDSSKCGMKQLRGQNRHTKFLKCHGIKNGRIWLCKESEMNHNNEEETAAAGGKRGTRDSLGGKR